TDNLFALVGRVGDALRGFPFESRPGAAPALACSFLTLRLRARKGQPASLPLERNPLPLLSTEDPRPLEDRAAGDSLSTCCAPAQILLGRSRHLLVEANPGSPGLRQWTPHSSRRDSPQQNWPRGSWPVWNWSKRNSCWRDFQQEHLRDLHSPPAVEQMMPIVERFLYLQFAKLAVQKLFVSAGKWLAREQRSAEVAAAQLDSCLLPTELHQRVSKPRRLRGGSPTLTPQEEQPSQCRLFPKRTHDSSAETLPKHLPRQLPAYRETPKAQGSPAAELVVSVPAPQRATAPSMAEEEGLAELVAR